jgi:hypothetical protein
MFEHPADIMKSEKKETTLDAIMDVDETYQLKLPSFVPEDKPDSLPRINQDTMISVLNGEYNDRYGQIMVIDCRFEYEYDGGHINGATNFNDKEKLARQLFDSTITNNSLIVFHCEYSAHRAPLMYVPPQPCTLYISLITCSGPSTYANKTELSTLSTIQNSHTLRCTYWMAAIAHSSTTIVLVAFHKAMLRWTPKSMSRHVSAA